MSLLDLLTHFSRENLRKYRAEKKESVPAKDREKREGGLAYLYRLSSGERVSIDSGLFYLGRSAHVADYVVLNNPSISRMHAYILHDGGYYLVDNDSVNRSFLNGKMLSPYRRAALKTGDLIRLADEDFRFFLEEEK